MLQVSPVTTHGIDMDGANMIVSSHHGAGETFQNDAESSRCDIKAAGLEPDAIRVRNPETIIFQVDVSNEMFAAPSIRIEAVGETVEGSDRHMSPFSGSTMEVAPLLLLGWRRHRQIGIPDISATLPLAVSLLFPDLDVFAAVLDRLAAGVVHGQFISSTHEANVAGFRHFHLGRLPTHGQTGARDQILPDLPDRFLCRGCRRARRHHDGVLGIKRHRFVEVLGSRSRGPLGVSVAKNLFDLVSAAAEAVPKNANESRA